MNKHLTHGAVVVGRCFMTDILNKSIVLVLNRTWQAFRIDSSDAPRGAGDEGRAL